MHPSLIEHSLHPWMNYHILLLLESLSYMLLIAYQIFEYTILQYHTLIECMEFLIRAVGELVTFVGP